MIEQRHTALVARHCARAASRRRRHGRVVSPRVLLVTRIRVHGRPIAHVVRKMGLWRQCGSKWAAHDDQPERPPSRPPQHQSGRASNELEQTVLTARLDDPAGSEVLAVRTRAAARTMTRTLRRHTRSARGLRPGRRNPDSRDPCRRGRYEHSERRHGPRRLLACSADGGGWRVSGGTELGRSACTCAQT